MAINVRRGVLIAASTIVPVVLAAPVATAEQIPVTVHVEDAPAPRDPSSSGPEPRPTSAPPTLPGDPAPPAAPAPPPAHEEPGRVPAPGPPDAPQASRPGPSPLPRTGADALRLLRDAAAALAAGLLLLLAARPSPYKERP